jgi:hypothetical protein
MRKRNRSRGSWAVAALLLVYVVWGTTYFAIGIALQTMPPLLMNASRFLCAGVVMLLVALAQGQRTAHGAQWRNSALVGGLMVFLAMNCHRLCAKDGHWLGPDGHRGHHHAHVAGAVDALGRRACARHQLDGPGAWAWSVPAAGAGRRFLRHLAWARCWPLARRCAGAWAPTPRASSRCRHRPWPRARKWLTGGAMGWWWRLMVEPVGALARCQCQRSWLAWVYLLVFGTLVALNAYLWLLQNTSAALAGSYSFVNPAVALLVGAGIGHERLNGWVFAALPLIAAAR